MTGLAVSTAGQTVDEGKKDLTSVLATTGLTFGADLT